MIIVLTDFFCPLV